MIAFINLILGTLFTASLIWCALFDWLGQDDANDYAEDRWRV